MTLRALAVAAAGQARCGSHCASLPPPSDVTPSVFYAIYKHYTAHTRRAVILPPAARRQVRRRTGGLTEVFCSVAPETPAKVPDHGIASSEPLLNDHRRIAGGSA